jgi:hypothetical protein
VDVTELKDLVKATMIGVEVFYGDERTFIAEFDDWFEINGSGRAMRMRHGQESNGKYRETFMFTDPDVAFWFRVTFGGK